MGRPTVTHEEINERFLTDYKQGFVDGREQMETAFNDWFRSEEFGSDLLGVIGEVYCLPGHAHKLIDACLMIDISEAIKKFLTMEGKDGK